MAYQAIGIGSSANDGTGDDLRTAGDKVNDNFVEIYTLLGTGTALSSGISATASVVTLTAASITATTLNPASANGAALGSTSAEWSDLYLSDGSIIYLGADQDVTLTHVHDTGILINSTRQLQFGDSGTYIHQSADGVLDLVSDTELELNATTIDINGNVEISGTTAQVGVATFTARPVFNGGITIGDGDQIGSASDADAIAIASNGVVTFSQAPVFPDGSITVVDLDIDGATDIGAAIADADLFIVDDGAGGTNRKTTASRLKTYINATAASSVAADDIAAGDAAVTITTSSGDITIDAAASDSDIILKGTDGGADTTFLTIDGSAAGKATFNNEIVSGAVITSGAGLVIANAGNIGSVGDPDAIAIASDGKVTFSQEIIATSLDISGNVDVDGTLETDALTIAGVTLAETISDTVGAMVSSNTETGITVTYQDADNTIDFVVGTLNQNTTGSAATLTTARTIGGVSFDGSANINLPGVNTSGNQDTSGTAATVTVTDSTANTNFPVVFHDESNALLDDTGALRYNPSTGELLVPNLTVAGTTTQVNTVTMNAENAVVFEGATADAHETTLTVIDPTGDRTINLPNVSGTLPVLAAVSTTQISSTPEELNILDGATVVVGEINALDLGATAVGTAIASKAVILDSNKDYTGIRNFTVTGELDAATGDFSGDVDVDGTLEADAITVNGTALNEFISDTVGAMVGSNTETGIAVTYQDGDNTIDFALDAAQTTITSLLATDIKIGEDDQTKIDFETADEIHFYAANAHQIKLVDGALVPATDNDVDLGTSSVEFKDAYFDGTVTADAFAGPISGDLTGTLQTAAQGNVTSLGTLTTLTVDNIIINGTNIGHTSDTDSIAIASDGVVTFSQAPVFPDGSIAVADLDIDGATDIGAAIVDADLFIIDDGAGGTNRKTTAARIKSYISASATALDDLGAGDSAVTLTTSSGNITIDAAADDSDIILKGTDGGADTTFLTIDGSAAGEATFNAGIVIADAGNIGSASDKDAIAIASDGVVTMNQIPVFSAGINVSGGTIAGTLATAAQANITSLGTLTTLTVDNIIINGTNIGHTSDTDSIAIASDGVVTFSQAPVFPDGSINIADIDLDGGTDIGANIADADLFLVDDGGGGTMRKMAASRLKTYISASTAATAADDIAAGDAAVTITTDTGNITIDAAANDSDIILKGTDGGADTTFLTIDGSAAGEATFNAGIVIADAGVIGSASDKDAIAIGSDGDVTLTQDLELQHDGAILSFGADDEVTLTHVHNDGLLLNTDMQLQFRDSAINIRSDADGDLDINADDEIELNSTLIDINGNLDVSGTIVGASTLSATTGTFSGILKTDDATEATSTTDGSLQTDGGLSVVKDIVAGDDIKLLSDAAVMHFGANSEITLTHVHDVGLTVTNTINGTDNRPTVLQLKSEEDAIVANDVIASIEMAAGDSDGTDGATVAAGIHAIAEDTFSASANATKLVFTTGVSETAASSATAKMTLSSAGLLTIADDFIIKDGGTIGSASDTDAIAIGSDGDVTLTQDLELQHDGAILSFGANDDVTVTHVHDTGLLLNAAMVMQFRDSAINIGSPADGDLDINADDEIELNSTLIDVNGNLDVSGTIVGASTLSATTGTFSGILKTDDATEATSTTDGSLQTDGGLSVVKDAVFGDDIKLLSDAAVMHFGANSEITLTHVHDVGLTLTHVTAGDNLPVVLQLKSEEDAIIANEVIGSLEFAAGDSDGTDGATVAAGIHAIAEGTFSASANATKLVFTTGVSETAASSATAKATLSSIGDFTVAGDLIIKDGGTIGSASDLDAIAIAADGVVTMNQIPVFSAGINVSGGSIAGTLSTAAQGNITSLGTLTTLTVDNVVINGATIGHGDDTDLMTVADGILTVAGEVSLTTLDIGGTNVTSTAAELNILDGVTSTAAELNALDGITAVVGELNALDLGSTAVGNAIASKAVILDSNKDYTGLRNFTIDGDLDVGDDLFLTSDAAKITFGANSEITATHVHNVGLTLTHTATGDNTPMVLQLKSEEDAIVANEVIGSLEFAAGDSDGTDGATVAAGIHAIAEGTFSASANATKLVFTTGVSETAASSATAKMTLSSAGLLTIADDFVIKDGGTIGVASDADAITIASNGQVTLTQTLIGTALDISGDVDIDGTLEADAITVNGTTLAETISDTVGAMVGSNTETGIAVTYQDGDNTIDFAINAAQTTITSLLATDIKIGEDDQTKIDFETADEIHFYAANAHQIKLVDGALVPVTDNDVDLGTSSLEFKDAFFDGTVTSDAFAGPLTGDVTGTSSKVQVSDADQNENYPVVFHNESNHLLDDTGALRYNPSSGTLLVPNLVVAGTTTQVDTVTMNAENAVVFEGATADAHETTLTVIDPTGDRTINLPNVGGTLPVLAAASTTQISSTPEELNILDGATVVVGEINALDLGSTAVGTAIASKAVILDSNKDYTGMRNLTISGEIDAATGDFSGDVDIDGTLEADAITVNGTALAEFISDTAGAMVSSNTETGISVTYQDGDNTIDFAIAAAQTTITSLLATDIKIGEDDQTKIDFETADEIHFYAANAHQVKIVDGAIVPATDNDVDLGTSSAEFKDAYFDGTVTADAFAGPITGNLTGTLQTAAQGNVTSLGTLTALTVDNIAINGANIGHTGDTDAIAIDSDGLVTFSQKLTVNNSGADSTSIHAEENIDVGNDIKLLSDAAVIKFGANSEITATHVHNVGLTLTHTATGANTPMVLELKSEEDAITSANIIGALHFTAGDSDGTDGATVAAAITAQAEGTFSASANATKLVFTTGVSETASLVGGVANAKMTLSSGGNLNVTGTVTGTGTSVFADLDISGDVDIDGTLETDAFSIGGTTVTSTAAELNILDGVTSTAAELNALDGITAVVGELNALDLGSTAVGTAIASKAVILDSNKDYTGMRNLTISGEIDAATGDFSGAVDVAGATTTTTITASGIIKTDDATEATSTTDGSLQTDGGLSVVKDAVFGDDIKLLSDAAVAAFGANGDVTLTHVHNTGLLLNAAMVMQFRDSAINIGSPADGDLDINADDEIELNSTLIDVNGNLDVSGTIVGASTLSATTGTFSGILKTDDATEATSTTDGSLQTDGGLSVVKDIVAGDDIKLLSDAAVIHFGANSEITATHVHNVGLTLTHTATGDNTPMVLQLKSEEDAIVANEVIGSLEFAAGDSDGTDGATVAAGIHAIAEGTFSASANATKLVFTTGVSETAASSATAKMTLSSAGLLTIADDFVIKDGGTIGVASDADSMTIASNGVVTFSQIPLLPDNTVSTGDLQADAVTGAKIADDAINSEHYTDGSIDTAHIADDQITQAKMANDSVGSAEMKTLSTLVIKDSGGNPLKTVHGAGA